MKKAIGADYYTPEGEWVPTSDFGSGVFRINGHTCHEVKAVLKCKPEKEGKMFDYYIILFKRREGDAPELGLASIRQGYPGTIDLTAYQVLLTRNPELVETIRSAVEAAQTA